MNSEEHAEQAADKVRECLMDVNNPRDYNQGVNDGVEAVVECLKEIREND